MDHFELVKPSLEYSTGFEYFYYDYKESGEKMVPFVLNFYENVMVEYLELLDGFTKGIRVSKGFIEHSTFWLKNDKNEILGVTNIRHRLTDSLRKEGGHIGYGVAPIFRRKGYATIMLKLALSKAKELGIDRALLTCNKENLASAKTIINNSGVLDSEVQINGKIIQHYWIDI